MIDVLVCLLTLSNLVLFTAYFLDEVFPSSVQDHLSLADTWDHWQQLWRL